MEKEIRLLRSYLNDVEGAIRENKINMLRLLDKRDSLEKEEMKINRKIQEMEQHILIEGSRSHVLSYSDRGVQCNVDNCEVNKVDSGGKNRSKLSVGEIKKNPPLSKII